MTNSRSILRGASRAVAGVVGVGVVAAVIGAAALMPLPGHSIGPAVVPVTPVPTDQQLVCPGPLLALAADSTNAGSAASFGSPSTVSGSLAASGSGAGSGTGTELGTVQESRLKSGGVGSGAPLLVTVPVADGSTTAPLVAGGQSQRATEDDIAGLATSACGVASADSWLVAGATTIGQTSLVLLTNPTQVSATVDLTVYGEAGPVESAGATGVTVPAGQQKVVPLAGIAPNVAAPVVHVRTRGGEVLASMQQSFEQGIQPRGVELSASTLGPSTEQRVPGVMVRTSKAIDAGQSDEEYDVNQPALRVLVPGAKAAHVSVSAVGESGTEAGNAYTATLKPGVVTEIPLTQLPDGDYTLTVTSDAPVVAAARTATVGSSSGTSGSSGASGSSASAAAHEDFAWFTASAPLPARFLAAVAPGAGDSVRLHLVNPSATDAAVSVTPPSGPASRIEIPAGSAVSLPAQRDGVYVVSGAAGLVASVGYAGDGVISASAVERPAPLASPITVYTR
ncbi:DUF5719 family protein [Microbacterium sp. STN6]|uniref:DUF5719 family protein n=1 Tax=Microbacterium sp. STN6 TaxID=2995588 RepID=UPI002261014D|nr:DUF5719 family protein [Microbacterium sp. STN6]MCX7521070.1 DUF5719 family protein [Microbacterium sp. STN6]